MNLRSQCAQQMRLAGPGLSEHEERTSMAALDMLGRARPRHLVVEHLANLGVDRFDVERIARVDLRAVCDRREDFGPIRAAEGDCTRIDAKHGLVLEQRA
ncbi:MAG: hypothetical protein AB7L94_23490 [Kofleriaceae bacterium]